MLIIRYVLSPLHHIRIVLTNWRVKTTQQLSTAVISQPDRDVFESIQQQLWQILSLQWFPKFKETEFWKKFISGI